MASTSRTAPPWSANGLIFENCSCTLICPGHMHFSQLCTHDRCRGYWAMRFDNGSFGEVPLAGMRALVVFDTPQRMIDGGWIETVIVDESAASAQREALETILTGQAGGPWEVLGRFVERRLATQFLPIVFEDEGAAKRATIAGLLKSVVTQIRGRDRSRPVLFENIFNQIHAPTQTIALGDTEYDDGTIRVKNQGTHGLFSNFEWRVDSVAG